MADNKKMIKILVPVIVAIITLVGAFFAIPLSQSEQSNQSETVININNHNELMNDQGDDVSGDSDPKETSASTLNEKVMHPVILPKSETIEESNSVMKDGLLTKDALNNPVVESGMITFALKKVLLSGQTLKFDFELENKSDDGRLFLGKARIIANGVECRSYRINIAKTGNDVFDLPSGIPVQMQIIFNDTQQDMKMIQMLEFEGSVKRHMRENVKVKMENLFTQSVEGK